MNIQDVKIGQTVVWDVYVTNSDVVGIPYRGVKATVKRIAGKRVQIEYDLPLKFGGCEHCSPIVTAAKLSPTEDEQPDAEQLDPLRFYPPEEGRPSHDEWLAEQNRSHEHGFDL